MLCKRGLCRHAVSVRVSVCLYVTFVDSDETNKHIFKFFSPPGSHIILVFPHQNVMAIFRRGPPPLTRASNAGRNGDSEPISGFITCCQRCDRLGVINTVPPDRDMSIIKKVSVHRKVAIRRWDMWTLRGNLVRSGKVSQLWRGSGGN